MDHKPQIGTQVRSSRGVVGTVVGWPKKSKHQDKVAVRKVGWVGCNATIMIKYTNLEEVEI